MRVCEIERASEMRERELEIEKVCVREKEIEREGGRVREKKKERDKEEAR